MRFRQSFNMKPKSRQKGNSKPISKVQCILYTIIHLSVLFLMTIIDIQLVWNWKSSIRGVEAHDCSTDLQHVCIVLIIHFNNGIPLERQICFNHVQCCL